jgi:hypothetical protein
VNAALVLVLAALAVGCEGVRKAERIETELVEITSEAQLRTSIVGGRMTAAELAARKKVGASTVDLGEGDAALASYVLVDARNNSVRDAYVTLDGVLAGDAGRTASLKAESLFVPAGATRTFLLLDDALAPQPWAKGVEVKVVGAVAAKFPPPISITNVEVSTVGDHVVASATIGSTAHREGKGIVHAAFHDEFGKPLSRGHSLHILLPGKTEVVRFAGPPHSKTATIFAGESTF